MSRSARLSETNSTAESAVQVPRRVDLRIPPLAFGCGANAGLMVSGSRAQRREVVSTALTLGIRCFDSAPAYGNGKSEQHLGETLNSLGATDVDIFTKVLLDDAGLVNVSEGVRASVATSLQRMGRSGVAGITLHNRVCNARDPSRRIGIGPVVSVDDVLGPGGMADALDELRAQGTVDLFGFTTVGGDREAVDTLMASGRFDYINAIDGVLRVVDNELPEMSGNSDDDIIEEAASAGLGVLALRVFGGGLLFEPQPLQAPLVRALSEWSRNHDMSVARMALRYVLSKPEITSAIIGFTRPEHVKEAAAALADGPLSQQQLDELATLQDATGKKP